MRLQKIINLLVDSNTYITLDFLASANKVSKRTIQHDISYLVTICKNNGFVLNQKRGKGYLIEITDHNLFNSFLEELIIESDNDTSHRDDQLLSLIVLNRTYITSEELADKFKVSNSLIIKSLPRIEQLANRHQLRLITKRHYGIKIEADDYALVNYYFNEYQDGNQPIIKAIDNKLVDFNEVEAFYIQYLKKLNLTANYHEISNFLIYLKIYLFINSNNEYINYENRLNGLFVYLRNKYDICFSLEHIKQLNIIFEANVRDGLKLKEFDENLEKIINNFLKEQDLLNGTDFNSDEQFKSLLINHLSLLIGRLHNKITYSNPLNEEIRITHPNVFNLALLLSEALERKYKIKISIDEIGFIATHFAAHMEKEYQKRLNSYNKIGIVCASGGGSSYLLKLQIESVFPRACVSTFSYLNIDDLLEYDPDLILTVIPLENINDRPIVYIKELLTDEDLFRLKSLLQNEDISNFQNDSIINLFTSDLFKISNGDSYQEVIKEMALEIEDKGYSEKGYKDLVIERESYVSTIYFNGVAIPHPMTFIGNYNVISVNIIRPTLNDQKPVKIIFMVNLKKKSLELNKQISLHLYHLMQDPIKLQKVLNVESYEEFIIALSEGGI